MVIGVAVGVVLVLILLVVGRQRRASLGAVSPASHGAKADGQGGNRNEDDWSKTSDVTVRNGAFIDSKHGLSGKVPTGSDLLTPGWNWGEPTWR